MHGGTTSQQECVQGKGSHGPQPWGPPGEAGNIIAWLPVEGATVWPAKDLGEMPKLDSGFPVQSSWLLHLPGAGPVPHAGVSSLSLCRS